MILLMGMEGIDPEAAKQALEYAGRPGRLAFIELNGGNTAGEMEYIRKLEAVVRQAKPGEGKR
jgi:hypothetical protein